MNRGRDYYLLVQEKEQLLARLEELEQQIKSKTENLLLNTEEQEQTLNKGSFKKNKNPNDEFGVLITNEDLIDVSPNPISNNPEEKHLNKNHGKFQINQEGNIENISLKAGKPVRSQGELQYKNKTYQLEFIKTPLLINGNVTKVLTLVKDISTNKISPNASELIKLVFETSDDFIVMKDLNQNIISANTTFIKAIGRTKVNDVKGLSDFDLFGDTPLTNKNQKEIQIAQKLKKGESIESDSKFTLIDGSSIDVLIKHFPIYNNNDLIATASIYRNITSLKNEHRKLLRSEEKYRMIIENQGEGACIIDSYYRFIFANSSAERLFDAKKHGLIDKPLRDFISEEDFFLIKTDIEHPDKINTKSLELEITSLNNTKKYVLLTLSPFYNDRGQIVGSFILLRDITKRRKIENELLKSENSLKDTIATKDKFFSIIAHDLKNPFGSIMGFSELILRKLKTNNLEKIEHYAKIIHSASKHGFELLENLLTWSRAQNGSLKYSPTIVSLEEIVNHNIDVLNESAQNKQLYITNLITKNYNVFIDEDMINTVLRNLLSNAIKYSNPNSNITISVDKTENNYVHVAIADEGVGINKSNLDQLFRIDSNKSTHGTNGEEGTGLGLILCKEFIEKNKGEIWAESIPNKGSIFYFTLPLAN